MDEFMEKLNDVIAPLTRAWKSAEILTVTVGAKGQDRLPSNEMIISVKLKIKK